MEQETRQAPPAPARDKAARVKNAAEAARARGLLPCAVVDGKRWSEHPKMLIDIVIATDGRTYSLSTLVHLLEMPEIAEQHAGPSQTSHRGGREFHSDD